MLIGRLGRGCFGKALNSGKTMRLHDPHCVQSDIDPAIIYDERDDSVFQDSSFAGGYQPCRSKEHLRQISVDDIEDREETITTRE
jgi:hypothetical protein